MSEVLKSNTTLTKLNLGSKNKKTEVTKEDIQQQITLLIAHKQTTTLEMSEQHH